MKKIIQDLTKEELAEKIKPSFRAKQIYSWIYHKYVMSFEEMKNLPKEMREKLDEEYVVSKVKDHTDVDLGDFYTYTVEDPHIQINYDMKTTGMC